MRIRAIRPDGNKLLLDVAGRPAVLRQLDFVLPDICAVSCHPEHAEAVRGVVGTSAVVVPYKAYEEPWGLAKFLQDMTWHMGDDVCLSLLFCDTLFLPGTDYTELTIPGTVVVAKVADRGRFLNVELSDGEIVGWVDRPHDREAGMATVGLYTMRVGEWKDILKASDEDNAGYKFLERANLQAIETDRWIDIGTEESLADTVTKLEGCGSVS